MTPVGQSNGLSMVTLSTGYQRPTHDQSQEEELSLRPGPEREDPCLRSSPQERSPGSGVGTLSFLHRLVGSADGCDNGSACLVVVKCLQRLQGPTACGSLESAST